MSLKTVLIVDLVHEDDREVGANIRTYSTTPAIKVLGSTMRCSAMAHEKVNFFSVERGDPVRTLELDVLAVQYEPGGSSEPSGHFIVVDWTKEKPFDLDRGLKLPWLRMASISNGRIDVRIDDAVFTTMVTTQHKNSGKQIYHLPDADLLCAYLADHASAQDLYDRAVQVQQDAAQVEILVREIARLGQHLEDSVEQIAKLREELDDYVWRNDELQKRADRLDRNSTRFYTAARVWLERYDTLSSAVRARGIFAWILRRMVNDLNSGDFHDWGREIKNRDILSCLSKEELGEL